MNDQSKPISEIEKDLLARRHSPRTALKAKTTNRKVSAEEAAERSHADFPKTIKYLGQ